jgi:hypothetical protein
MIKTSKYRQNSGKKKSHLLSFSIFFFSGSILLSILLLHNHAYAAEPDKYGPKAEECLSEPDHYIYAYHTKCTGSGNLCVPTNCPPYPNPD